MIGKKKLGKRAKRWIAFTTALLILVGSLTVGEIPVSAKEPDTGVAAVGAEGTEGAAEGDIQPGEETKPEGDTQPGEETRPEGDTLPGEETKPEGEIKPEEEAKSGEETAEGLTAFKDVGDRGMQIDYGKKTISMDVLEGDHFVMYNGLESPANAFLMEADVSFTDHAKEDGHKCAGLVFGAAVENNPSEKWYAAYVDTRNPREGDMFRVFEANTGTHFIDEKNEGDRDKIDLDSPLHLKLEMQPDGNVVYTFGNKGAEDTCSISKKIVGWTGGYVGLVTWESGAVFSNITFEDRLVTLGETVEGLDNWKTNLDKTQIRKIGEGSWTGTENGLYGNAEGKGDCFLLTEAIGNNFIYSTDVIFDEGVGGAAALIFRSNNDIDTKESYAVNIDAGTHKCKFWRWQKNDALQLIDEKEVEATADRKYNLEVVAVDSWILYYVNDKLIASTGDYTLQPGNRGQSTVIKEGYFGLLNWNSKVTFQNTYYKELDDSYDPLLNDIEIEAASGTVEARPQFMPTEPITIQYVKNDVSAVKVNVGKKSEQAEVKVMDNKGNVYDPGTEIPVNLGINWLTITSKATGKVKDAGTDTDVGLDAVLTYRVNVHRLKPDDVYYNEPYRGQYHYSLKEGWANDPNGMVYYKGKYHLF